MTTTQQESLPIKRIKCKGGGFAVTVAKGPGRASKRLGTYDNATDAVKAYKEFLATGNYHEHDA